jgi:outer membrane protein TolC
VIYPLNRYILISCLIFLTCVASASVNAKAEPSSMEPLPSPLTLKYALSLAGNDFNSDVQVALSEQLQAQSEQDLFKSSYDFQIAIQGQLASVKPSGLLSENFSNRNNDHQLSLSVTKRLYDFGRKTNQLDVSGFKIKAANIQIMNNKKHHYLKILRSYFDVILSDLEYLYANEVMAVSFIQFDRARSNFELKKISELELLRLETEYKTTNVKRIQSQNNQRIKRSILAITLDQPEQLPSDLQVPDLSAISSFSINRELPDIKKIQTAALENNLQLKQINYHINAEKKQQQVYYANKNPIIRAKLESSWYSRELGGDDRAMAALSIEIPLYQGKESSARVSMSQAIINKLLATYKSLSLQLRQQSMEIWMQLQNLKQQYQQLKTELNYRELYLDKSRVEYDSELKSDLGNAMVYLSAVQLLEKKVLFEIAYQWAQLDILMDNDKLYAYSNK